jgi:CheY-like chemotaxis protein
MKRVLLIDDDEDDREFFLNAVDTIDPSIACEVAWNGKVAIETLLRNDTLPDVVFLDLNMPIMGGKQFLAELRHHQGLEDLLVVVLSTSSDQATVSEVLDLGARYFITKPNKLSLLEQELRRLFEKMP